MFYKYIFIFLLIILNLRVSFAQNVSGRVVDKESGEGLGMTTMLLIEGRDTFKRYSDFEGNFLFVDLEKGAYQLIAQYIGLEAKQVTFLLQGDTVINLELNGGGCILLPELKGKERAQNDWKYQSARIYYTSETNLAEMREAFTSKYKVYFSEIECVDKEQIEYQKTIYKFLNKEYGKAWRKEIKKAGIKMKKKRCIDEQ